MRLAGIVTAMMLLPAVAWSQQGPKAPPPRPRPNPDLFNPTPRSASPTSGQIYVGDRAPDFELDRSTGQPAKLSSFRGKWTLLTFGDRRAEVAALRAIEPDLDSIDVQIVSVSHERPQTLKALAARVSLRFALLSDGTGQVSSMYGLYDPARSEILPGFIVLDPNGVVRVALLGKTFPPEDVARLVHFVVGRP